MAEGFAGERDAAVWRRIVGGLAELDRVLPADARPALRERVGRLVAPALEDLGWDARSGERDLDRELRAILIGAAVALAGDVDATDRARALFARVRAGDEVEANVAGAVLRAVAAVAGPDELAALEAGWRAGGTPQEEQRYLFAMAEVRDPELFDHVLGLATSTDVRTQNAPYLLMACLANGDNGPRAWAAIRERWDDLLERFPSNSIARMLQGVRSLHDPEVTADVEAFLADHTPEQGKLAVAQHLERMHVTARLAAAVRG
jgi:puromycin-sensitive aminopeptidase